MDDEQIDMLMNDGFLREKMREYEKHLGQTLSGLILLEQAVHEVFLLHIRGLNSKKLEKWAETSLRIPVSQKLKFLRFANVIDEDTYNDLNILFDIRNTFAHDYNIANDLDKPFEKLSNIAIPITIRSKVVKNPSAKYLLVYIHYLEKLGDIEEGLKGQKPKV